MPVPMPTSVYFAGQGLVYAAKLDRNGEPMGYFALGNVTSLVLNSQAKNYSRLRHLDGATQQTDEQAIGLSGSLTANLENISQAHRAMLFGSTVRHIPAVDGQSFFMNAYTGGFAPLIHLGLTDVVGVECESVALTGYSPGAAAFDYAIDERAGLLYINDGSRGHDAVGLKEVAEPVTEYSLVDGFLAFTPTYYPSIKVGATGVLLDPGPSLTARPCYGFKVSAITDDGAVVTNIRCASLPELPEEPAVAKFLTSEKEVLVTYSAPRQLLTAGEAHHPEGWSFIFKGINQVDNRITTVRVPTAFIRRKAEQDLIQNQLASFGLEATMLSNLRNKTTELFSVETDIQGIADIAVIDEPIDMDTRTE